MAIKLTSLAEQFIEEVAEGMMPKASSPEAKAYREWRVADDAERRWERMRLAGLHRVYTYQGRHRI